MTYPPLSILALILTVVLCSGHVYAQKINSTENAQNVNAAALREKAFTLLESLAGQIGSLQSAENRARMGSNIADSLWKHDENRARTLLISVQDDIRAGLQNRDSDDPEDLHTLMVFLKLRLDTVERIAKHDGEVAFAFLKATEMISDKPLPPEVVASERALELRLAKEFAGSSPDLALKLGRQSLGGGFSDALLSLLRQLHRKHREQGVILYKETVVKLRDANLALNWNAMYFARNLAESLPPPLADEASFRDLINILLTTVLAQGCGDQNSQEDRTYLCNQYASLVTQMEKIDPSRAAPLEQWATTQNREAEPLRAAYYELNDLAESGTVDEILALASKYPQIEIAVNFRAIAKAQASGDSERARKIAAEYQGDPGVRLQMLAQVALHEKSDSKDEQQLAEVQRILSTIPRIAGRVSFLLSTANRFGASDRNAALRLLSQASGMIDTMKPGKDQTEAQLGLAMMYCQEKSDRGLAIMESMMPKLNDLVAAAVKLDRYDNHYLRDGEWNMTGEGTLGSLLTQLAQNAGYFAWCDFDRAVSLAAQFERAEIRLMAQLKLAQGILAGPPLRRPMGNNQSIEY